MRLAVLDLETDPFQADRVPEPFLSGFYDGTKFVSIWDDTGELVRRTVDMLTKEEPCVLYAHNGGKFDWYYFLQHLQHGASMRIVNGRIIQADMGRHEIRDSYSIMPFALAKYKKTRIDYAKFERARRNAHRDEIVSYLRDDCKDLWDLVAAYRKEFGDVLTIGSAAMKELRKLHTYSKGNSQFDEKFRNNYYYGGRVQLLDKKSEVKGPVKVYDVNSMYPFVMASMLHPVSCEASVSKWIEEDTSFVQCEGWSNGAFAVRSKTGIHFPVGYGVYHTTIHEFTAAIETGSFRLHKLLKTYGFRERVKFDTFVNKFYDARIKAELEGDKVHKLFYKYILNSAYGKFAQNPENFYDYEVSGIETRDAKIWEVYQHNFECEQPYIVWRRKSEVQSYYNIATAASITGAARSILLRGIHLVESPLYCDTDSIIAHGPGTLQLDDTVLGAWKTEVTGDSVYFGGKKIYAIFDTASVCPLTNRKNFDSDQEFEKARGETHRAVCGTPSGSNRHCVKKAHKGFGASGADIMRLAHGGEIRWRGEVPHFKLSGEHGFVSRTIRNTI